LDWPALFPEALAKNRTDNNAKPVRSILDMVVDLSVGWPWRRLNVDFSHVVAVQAKKHF
jgi:hypothetical protein